MMFSVLVMYSFLIIIGRLVVIMLLNMKNNIIVINGSVSIFICCWLVVMVLVNVLVIGCSLVSFIVFLLSCCRLGVMVL